jgi:hypothetical protein
MIGTCFAPIRISGRVVSASTTLRVGGRGRNPGDCRDCSGTARVAAGR